MLVTTGMFASSLLLIPTGNQWHRIRFLRLTRADGRDNYMHVHRLNAYDLSQRHIAITGTVYPQHDNGIYDWQTMKTIHLVRTTLPTLTPPRTP